jgi:hypothetical protein
MPFSTKVKVPPQRPLYQETLPHPLSPAVASGYFPPET